MVDTSTTNIALFTLTKNSGDIKLFAEINYLSAQGRKILNSESECLNQIISDFLAPETACIVLQA